MPCIAAAVHPAGTLVVSSIATPHTAAPLLRYCIGDAGGILSYSGAGAGLSKNRRHVHGCGHEANGPVCWSFREQRQAARCLPTCPADMLGFLKQHGFEPPPGLPCRALPFAFVFGR